MSELSRENRDLLVKLLSGSALPPSVSSTGSRDALWLAMTDIVTRIPTDGNDFVLGETLDDTTATVTTRSFSAAAVAPVVTLLNAVAATIDNT